MVYPNQSIGLKSVQITRNDFAHRPKVQGNFLMGPGQREWLATGPVGKLQQRARQTLADASEGHAFDHRDQRAQAAAEDGESLQWNLRMLKADGPEIPFVNKEDDHRIDRLHRCRIWAPIKQWHFGNGCWRGLNSQCHLPSRWRR